MSPAYTGELRLGKLMRRWTWVGSGNGIVRRSRRKWRKTKAEPGHNACDHRAADARAPIGPINESGVGALAGSKRRFGI